MCINLMHIDILNRYFTHINSNIILVGIWNLKQFQRKMWKWEIFIKSMSKNPIKKINCVVIMCSKCIRPLEHKSEPFFRSFGLRCFSPMTWATTAVTTTCIFYKQNCWRKLWNVWWYTYHGFDKAIIFKWLQLVLVVCKTPLQKHLLRFLKVDCWSSLNLESLWTPKAVLVCQFTLIFGLHSQLKQLVSGMAGIFKCASCVIDFPDISFLKFQILPKIGLEYTTYQRYLVQSFKIFWAPKGQSRTFKNQVFLFLAHSIYIYGYVVA